MARTNLKILRVRFHLSQQSAAERIGCGRATYAAIESGKRDGRKAFWNGVQIAFNIPPGDMWELMKNDAET